MVRRPPQSRGEFASRCRQSASREAGSWKVGSLGCMVSTDLGIRGATMTRKWPISCRPFWRELRHRVHTGRCGVLVGPRVFPRVPCSAIFGSWAFSPIGPSLSSYRLIRTLWRRFTISWGYILILLCMRWGCGWMRSPRSKLLSVPSQYYPRDWDM
jgi:hypothetical protein